MYSTEILLNTAINDQRGKLDWNLLKFYGERNTGLHAITTPSYKQPSKLSQLQNTQLNLLTVTFLAILNWTEINLRWLIVDGSVKKAKDMWTIDQVWGQDGRILVKFFFCMFMDRDGVEVHKLAQKERGQYPAILTKQAWSIKDLLYGFREIFLAGHGGYSRAGKIAPSCPHG